MSRSMRGKVVPLTEGDVVDQDGNRNVAEGTELVQPSEPRPFPIVSTLPHLPAMIPDEILNYYGWVFCQGGFLNLQMTFEQFLAVVAAVSPSGLCPECDGNEVAAPID